ncbi:MAG: S41 family peptidase [Flavobacteriaceae bacterium]
MKKSIWILWFLVVANVSFAQMPNTLSNSDKVYGLSKFWQEVNYNFVYLDKVDREKWESDYKQLIAEVQETSNDYEYYRLLQRFCASLKDGHTNVYFPESLDSLIYNTWFGKYRLFLKNIDGKAIVVRTNLSKKEEIPIGTEILEVNGIPTKEYAETYVKPYIASSTDYILENNSIAWLLQSPKGTSYDVRFKKPNGDVFDLQLTHSEVTEKEVYPPFEDRDLLDFKWLDDKIAYMSLNSFSQLKIDSLFLEKLPELRNAKKLIVDLRNNGGGSTGIGTYILQYLTHDKELRGSVSQSRLHIPSFKAWGKWTQAKDTINGSEETREWNKQALLSYQDNYYHKFPHYPAEIDLGRKERVVVPTALLIGNNTASAAEDFLIAADNQEHMIKIGEPTYGSTGQPLVFDLPGGGSARVCTKKDTYPDGREFVGVGIQPDMEVKKTLADYLNHKDPVLEKAVAYLKQQ